MPAAKKIPEIVRTTDGRPYAQEGFKHNYSVSPKTS